MNKLELVGKYAALATNGLYSFSRNCLLKNNRCLKFAENTNSITVSGYTTSGDVTINDFIDDSIPIDDKMIILSSVEIETPHRDFWVMLTKTILLLCDVRIEKPYEDVVALVGQYMNMLHPGCMADNGLFGEYADHKELKIPKKKHLSMEEHTSGSLARKQ